MSLSGDGVKALREGFAQPQVVLVDGVSRLVVPNGHSVHSTRPGTVDALVVHSLSGVVQYLKDNADALPLARTVVHVRDESTVWVIGALGSQPGANSAPAPAADPFVRAEDYALRRLVYVVAEAPALEFPFGHYVDLERFNIGIQTQFVDDEARKNLLKVLGSVSDGTVREANDDGLRQEAVVRSGVTLKERALMPSAVLLAPYRTFREVAQPSSLFVLRLKSAPAGSPNLPTAALFEADGASWKLEAIKRSAEYLKAGLEGTGVKVLA